jgi:hypothetical protein
MKETEPVHEQPSIPVEAVHPVSTPKRTIDLRTISFEVDRPNGKNHQVRQPMVAHKIQMQMQDCETADSTQ